MAEDDNEEQRLRAAALKNVESILVAAATRRARAAGGEGGAGAQDRGAAAAARVVRGHPGQHRRCRHHDGRRRPRHLPESGGRDDDGLVARARRRGSRCATRLPHHQRRHAPTCREPDRQGARRPASVVGLANHTALLARTAPNSRIEDSAAPIRDPQGHDRRRRHGVPRRYAPPHCRARAASQRRAVARDVRAGRRRHRASRVSTARFTRRTTSSARCWGIRSRSCDTNVHSGSRTRGRPLRQPNAASCGLLDGVIAELRDRKALRAQETARCLEQHDRHAC